ncbi:MAG: CvpA family protein [Clostridia bacterium]|nr:CvpA family protein [Clostridia bacterium]
MSITLDLLFVIIAIVFIFLGIFRGFIKSVIRSAKLILAFVLAYFLGDKLGMLFKNSSIGNWVYGGVYNKVNELYRNATASLDPDEVLSHFPDFIVNDELRQTIANSTSQESGEALVESVATGIADPISNAISNVLGYILVFALALVGLTVVAWLLTKLIDKIAFLGLANHILGGVWGALTAALLMIVVSSVIKLFFGNDEIYTSSVLVKFFGDSGLLQIFGIFDVGNLVS